MSENSEKLYIDPRPRRVNESFEWIGTNLANHAWEVVERVVDHLGVSGEEKREARIKKLLVEIRDKGFRPSKEVEPIELRQGKVAINEQRERHADLALRHAVVVYDEYTEGRTPVTRPPEGQLDKRLKLTFQRMQASLLQAQRHLTALDILKNLEKSHYGVRASKGGKVRSRAPSKYDHEALLAAMVKGMLYNNPDSIKRAKYDVEGVSHEWALKIYNLNREFEILDITSRGALKAEIQSLLIKRLKAGQEVHDREAQSRAMLFQMWRSRDEFRSEETDRMDTDLALERGRREGIQHVLEYLLNKEFGELPDEAREEIYAMNHAEDLQACLDHLSGASSWQEVIQGREADS